MSAQDRAALANRLLAHAEGLDRIAHGVTQEGEDMRAAAALLGEPVPADEREALQAVIGSVLFNAMNYPERVQAQMLGQDTRPLNDKITEVVIAAGFRRQGPITDTQIDAAADAIYAHSAYGLNGVESERLARAALEAARDAGSNQ